MAIQAMGQPTPTQAGGQSGLRGSKYEPNQPDRATPRFWVLLAKIQQSQLSAWLWVGPCWGHAVNHVASPQKHQTYGQDRSQTSLHRSPSLGAVGAQDNRKVVVAEEALRDM